MIRADFIVTYWVIFWYVFYVTGYIHQNPAPALWIVFMSNLFIFLAMIYYRVKVKTLLYYAVFIFFSKILLLWTIRDMPIQRKDILATAGMFIMYFGWILWEDKFSLLQHSMDIFENKYSTPAMMGMNRLFP
jgi:hypothetical protein